MPLRINGGGGIINYNYITTKTSNYVATTRDSVIICNSTLPISITIPSPSDAYDSSTGYGLVLNIKNINTGVVTIIGTVDGMVNPVIENRWDNVTIQTDGSIWYIL